MVRIVLRSILGLAAATTLLMAAPVSATVVFDLDTEYSGADAPEGPTPWARATFDDAGGSGVVTLTMEAINLIDDEFIGEWYFNFSGGDTPALGFSHVSGPAATSISQASNAFKAAGDGYFDLQFMFGANSFTAGSVVVYDILGAGITENDFLDVSYDGYGFVSAAHIQGIGTNAEGSGWITEGPIDVPAPGGIALLAMGLLGFRLARRSRLG